LGKRKRKTSPVDREKKLIGREIYLEYFVGIADVIIDIVIENDIEQNVRNRPYLASLKQKRNSIKSSCRRKSTGACLIIHQMSDLVLSGTNIYR
jgi:hypothetical protein